MAVITTPVFEWRCTGMTALGSSWIWVGAVESTVPGLVGLAAAVHNRGLQCCHTGCSVGMHVPWAGMAVDCRDAWNLAATCPCRRVHCLARVAASRRRWGGGQASTPASTAKLRRLRKRRLAMPPLPLRTFEYVPSRARYWSYGNRAVLDLASSTIFKAAGPTRTTKIAGKMNMINGAISLTAVFWARSSAAWRRLVLMESA